MSKLGELGLSSYEEKVYRSLLALGAGTAQGVSEASDVPTGRIYDVLNGLEARDLVRSRATEPTTYVAVDPETALDRLLDERRRELDARAERYDRLAGEVTSELAATTPSESQFWTAPLGSEAAVSLATALYDAAGRTVRSAMSLPYEGVDWERYEAEIDASLDGITDGRTTQVLVTPGVLDGVPPAVRETHTESTDVVEVRVTTDLTVTFDLIDTERACFHVPHPCSRTERLGVIDLRDASLAEQLATLFDEVWATAEPLASPVRNE
jgi:sugar-specific transcriptional regulator TrmB